MSVLESIAGGFSELLAHKMRSFLTMLGVIFGVAAVIAMVSIGEGARREALEQLKLLGVDIVRVTRKSLAGQALDKAQESSPFGLNFGDAKAVRETLSYVRNVVAVRQVTAELDVEGPPVSAKVMGVSPAFPEVTRSETAFGRFLTNDDDRSQARVCVLGSGIKRRLFGFENPLGKQIKLSGELFTVIGTIAEKTLPEKMVVDIPDQNYDIYIPISAAIKTFIIYSEQPVPSNIRAVYRSLRSMTNRQSLQNSPITALIIQTGSEASAPATAQLLSDLLKRRHKGIDDYAIDVPAELIRQNQETQRIFNIVMGAIAGISLIVGGIGIMNIMLATVTQRTREIGVRRCVGATRGDIMKQFLLEALVITLLGGFIGVFLGIGGAHAISEYAGWKTIVSIQAIVLSLTVACGVGVIFGLYPAIRAAHVDPITALRYE